MQFSVLPRSFFEPSAEGVASALLGHWLVRRLADGVCGGPIVEAEAYLEGDPASHGFIGQTARNRTMFGAPGLAYVYFIYGNHSCVNAVCRPAGRPEAVLIRAIEPQWGLELLQRNRPVSSVDNLTSGPGKLCAALGIDRSLDGADLCDPAGGLFIARNPDAAQFIESRGPRIQTTRVGLSKAADRPLRFYLAGSRFVSRKVSASDARSSQRTDRVIKPTDPSAVM